MKVITPRAAHLTNHEVLLHIQSLRQKYTQIHLDYNAAQALKAGNLETVMHEVTSYLTSLPSHDPTAWPPLESNSHVWAPQPNINTTTDGTAVGPKVTLKDLEARMEAFMTALPPHIHLEKPELLMLINNRPESQAELYLVIEDVETRMSEGDQGLVLDCIKRFWGGNWGDEDAEGEVGEEGGEGGGEEEGEEMVE